MTGSGTPGTPLEITVLPNNSGGRRDAIVTVTAGDQTRQLVVSQLPVLTQTSGTRVIERFARGTAYVDVSIGVTNTTIASVGGSSVRVPIWNFVHIVDNDFAIRNNTTGRYLTETNGSLRYEARISGAGTFYNNRQRWRLVAQSDGSYRIRSASSPNLFITECTDRSHPRLFADVILANMDAANNMQRWWIGYIWHHDDTRNSPNWVGFWDGTITMWVDPVGEHPEGFNFVQNMAAARDFWSDALGITFDVVDDSDHANIRAYGGCRFEIRDDWRALTHFTATYGVAIRPISRVHEDTIQAGGVTRDVYRLQGTGFRGAFMLVFSTNTSASPTPRLTNMAAHTAAHELGHALGYAGHSPNPNDLMYRHAPSTPNITLNPAELEHILQIYRRFRN